jgi:hypothetical protein
VYAQPVVAQPVYTQAVTAPAVYSLPVTITPTVATVQPTVAAAVYQQPAAAAVYQQPAALAVTVTQPGLIGRWVGHVGQTLAVAGQPRAYLPAQAPVQQAVYMQPVQAPPPAVYQAVTAPPQPVYQAVTASPQSLLPVHPWKHLFARW